MNEDELYLKVYSFELKEKPIKIYLPDGSSLLIKRSWKENMIEVLRDGRGEFVIKPQAANAVMIGSLFEEGSNE